MNVCKIKEQKGVLASIGIDLAKTVKVTVKRDVEQDCASYSQDVPTHSDLPVKQAFANAFFTVQERKEFSP